MMHWSRSKRAAPLYWKNQRHVGQKDHSKQRIRPQGRRHFRVTIKEQPGSNRWHATPERKSAHCGSEASKGLHKEEFVPFRKDEHWELGQPMNDGAGRRRDKRIEIGTLECLDNVPVHHEKGSRGRKGTLSNIRSRIVVELLGSGRPGRGDTCKISSLMGRKAVGGGGTPVGRGGAGRLSGRGGGSHNAIVKIVEATINKGQGGGQGRQ
jgi:hypothetical protein